ncbi:response regulator [Desulfonatronospira sp.]|uniref:response regulator n=1 Tax=Desulfonatronospira sp. TaxID=1962951 RepID=UPI0025BDCBED|nr:response regulator [Desulfonatronospira sp.]
MRVLIAEDDFVTRKSLERLMQQYGECDEATTGKEAVDCFRMAWEEKKPYDLILLDIMMPDLDGQDALQQIRDYERSRGIVGFGETKVIMVSALDDPRNVVRAFYSGGASSYLVKPIREQKLYEELEKLGFNLKSI